MNGLTIYKLPPHVANVFLVWGFAASDIGVKIDLLEKYHKGENKENYKVKQGRITMYNKGELQGKQGRITG